MSKYVVRTLNSSNIETRVITRRSMLSAFYWFDLSVYDVLKASGKLDTTAAWEAMRQVQALVQQGDIRPGDSRSILVSNTGYSVSIEKRKGKGK